MDFRQMSRDAYGVGQRRGMGTSSGGGGLGLQSSSFGSSSGFGNYGGGGGGGYGNNRNQSPDGGNFNRGGFNNQGSGNNRDFNGPPASNNNWRSFDDRGGFNSNNQRFENSNNADMRRGDFEDNYRPQGRPMDQDQPQRNSGNFNQDNFNRGNQQSQSRFFDDEFRNRGSFGQNDGPSFGGGNSRSFGGNGNLNDNLREQSSPNYGAQRPGFNDNFGRNEGGGNFAQNFGSSRSNMQDDNRDFDNFNNRGSGGFNNNSGVSGGYNNSGGSGGFNNSSGSGGFNNSGASGGYNNSGGSGGGYNNAGRSGGYNNSGGPGGFNNSAGFNNTGGSGFSNNISRSFQEANSRNWNNSQSSSFQSSGYQSGSGGGGGGALSGWEASQRAFNSKRNQLQKVNLNNGGAVRKPVQQPVAKVVQNIRNNPKTAAVVRNSISNNGNKPLAKPVGVQNKAPIGPPNKLKPTKAVPNASSASTVAKKIPVSGQQTGKPGPAGKVENSASKTGPVAGRAGNVARTGNAGKSGPQVVRGSQGPARTAAAAQGAKSGQISKNIPYTNILDPEIGQKRVAPPPPQSNEPVSKAEKKWRRVARKRGFLMGGFKIAYLNDQPRKIPQPEADSYAVAFFEQQFNYSTNQDADDEDYSSAAVVLNEDSDDEGADDGKSSRKVSKRTRKRIRSEWEPLYESKKYNDWANWWKDYKNVGNEINKQLKDCGDLNLEHCFLPNLPKLTTEQVVFAIIKSAHYGLGKNADVPFDTMKTIFTLMNRTFLENLTEVNMQEIQDIIRGIPNELWVYKMKSMVYLWLKYKEIANSTSKTEDAVRDQQATAREWKSPCFHWLAKQAFDELFAISATEWEKHAEIFPAADEE
ncbi:protein qua-1 [Drosophila bipectinata]|uniref:protein qua-1 n=1 Tax=Drosophila bipectinata TaxID=42026 RepID=UPI0038B29AD1